MLIERKSLSYREFDSRDGQYDVNDNFDLNSFPLIHKDNYVSSSGYSLPNLATKSTKSRTTQRRRQKKQHREKVSEKKDYPASFWHQVIEDPKTSHVEKLLIQLNKLEKRPWKEIQERIKERLGLIRSVEAFQMRVTRLRNRIGANLLNINTPTTTAVKTEDLPWRKLEGKADDDSRRKVTLGICQVKPNNRFENRINWSWLSDDQNFSQGALSHQSYKYNETSEKVLSWNGTYSQQEEWVSSEGMFYEGLCSQPINSSDFSMPNMSWNISLCNFSGLGCYHWPQSAAQLSGNDDLAMWSNMINDFGAQAFRANQD